MRLQVLQMQLRHRQNQNCCGGDDGGVVVAALDENVQHIPPVQVCYGVHAVQVLVIGVCSPYAQNANYCAMVVPVVLVLQLPQLK